MVEMILSGFLFLFIIITNVTSVEFSNKIISDLNSDAKLQKINDNSNKFKISIVLALIEHVSIIAISVMLFIAFSPYNITLEFMVKANFNSEYLKDGLMKDRGFLSE
ncbi:MAG: hypothetical protein CEE43_15975 [Promethearchaeota archaeon Loki_b32]|nr:MAG: hypothetical protein CEE43_15975 [Candidatus Lokiarchaeota archaeon Loki_b32]